MFSAHKHGAADFGANRKAVYRIQPGFSTLEVFAFPFLAEIRKAIHACLAFTFTPRICDCKVQAGATAKSALWYPFQFEGQVERLIPDHETHNTLSKLSNPPTPGDTWAFRS